jgi:hypothetical protein
MAFLFAVNVVVVLARRLRQRRSDHLQDARGALRPRAEGQAKRESDQPAAKQCGSGEQECPLDRGVRGFALLYPAFATGSFFVMGMTVTGSVGVGVIAAFAGLTAAALGAADLIR